MSLRKSDKHQHPELMMIKSSFDFCFTNPCFRGVTRRRGRIFGRDLHVFNEGSNIPWFLF